MDGKVLFYFNLILYLFSFSFWHACQRCNPTLEEDDFLGRRRVGDIWQRDLDKRNEVRQGMFLWTVWECEYVEKMGVSC
jgi:hypothetical protein